MFLVQRPGPTSFVVREEGFNMGATTRPCKVLIGSRQVDPGGYCSPRHPTHFAPSSLVKIHPLTWRATSARPCRQTCSCGGGLHAHAASSQAARGGGASGSGGGAAGGGKGSGGGAAVGPGRHAHHVIGCRLTRETRV